ncbi:MAG TPA: hypothetical protein VMI10_24915 [Terriglobales bacterium]|nr:hypothetical protein [Terriglobales bacterium]
MSDFFDVIDTAYAIEEAERLFHYATHEQHIEFVRRYEKLAEGYKAELEAQKR